MLCLFLSCFKQGDSVQAQALAKGIEEKLADLKSLVLQASSSAEKSGAKQLAHTLKSQIEAALRWLRNPAAFDHGYGKSDFIPVRFRS